VGEIWNEACTNTFKCAHLVVCNKPASVAGEIWNEACTNTFKCAHLVVCGWASPWAELGGCLGIPRNTQLFPQTIMYIWSMYICITYIRLYSLFSRLEISQIRSLEVPSPTNPLSIHVSIQSISRTFLYNRVLVPKNQNPVARMQIAACSRCLGWRGGTSRRKLAMH